MSGVDVEALVAQITARVTSEVLAALAHEPEDVVEEWPDYDEYGGEASAPLTTSVFVPSPDEQATLNIPQQPSSLRARAHGNIPEPVVIDDGPSIPSGATGDVLPIGATGATGVRGGTGFSPDPYTNGDWFVRNFQKDVLNQRRQPPAEDRVIAAGR